MSQIEGGRSPERQRAGYDWGKEGADRYKIEGVSPQQAEVYQNLDTTLKGGGVVVNLGSGDGRFELNAPKDRAYTIYGFELREKGVEGYYDEVENRKTLKDRVRERLEKLNVLSKKREKDEMMVSDVTQLDYRNETGEQELTADAAVSWRVLHALSREEQVKVCQDVSDMLPPGGSFYLAVLSDKDWKLDALRKAGKEYDGKDLIDCEGVMAFPENEGKATDDTSRRTDFEFFFSKESLQELAEQTGFEVVGGIQEFTEASGMPQLLNDPRNDANHPEHDYDRSKVTYYYAHFRKKAEGSSRPETAAA